MDGPLPRPITQTRHILSIPCLLPRMAESYLHCGVTILDLEDFEIGRAVISKKGKDKGAFYVIGKDALNNRVYVADGKHRSITRPKPKP